MGKPSRSTSQPHWEIEEGLESRTADQPRWTQPTREIMRILFYAKLRVLVHRPWRFWVENTMTFQESPTETAHASLDKRHCARKYDWVWLVGR
eukprot:scaffold1488_cov141-Amphora_coffeaeformis.AAC.9